MKPHAPDDSGMTLAEKEKRNRQHNADMGAFLPGQKRMLANELAWGFGGGTGNWKKKLAGPYGKTNIFELGRGNGNGDGKGNPTGPQVPGDPTGGGVTPVGPQHAVPMQGIVPAGILASVPVAMPNQMQQPGGILGGLNQLDPNSLPPEILAILRARQGM